MGTRRIITLMAFAIALVLVGTACASGGGDEQVRTAEEAEAATTEAHMAVGHDQDHGDLTASDGHGHGHHEAGAAEEPSGAPETEAGVADEPETRADGDGTVVEVEMTEFGYTPNSVSVSAGETVRFALHNVGAIAHEAMFGDAHMQEEFAGDDHADASGGHHGDVHAITLAPGRAARSP